MKATNVGLLINNLLCRGIEVNSEYIKKAADGLKWE
jgi:hypothetical protein